MVSSNLSRDLFNYSDKKDNDETVSLAGSYISSYDNMNNNIQDLVNIINGGGKPLKKNAKQNQSSCNLSTIKELSTNNDLSQNFNILPSDSVSNIDNNSEINIYNELKKITNDNLNTPPQQQIYSDNIDNSISKFASAIQHNTHNKTSANESNVSKLTYTKSIFDVDNSISAPPLPPPQLPPPPPTTTTSIFENNKNVQQNMDTLPVNTFTGGADSDFQSGLLIALFVVASFCFIGISSICTYFNSNVIYTLAFVLFIGLAILFIENQQKK